MDTDGRLEGYHFYDREWTSYEALREWFEWEIPSQFNISRYICDRWDGSNRVAIFARHPTGATTTYSFGDLTRYTDRLTRHLDAAGIEAGDRVAVNTPQKPETLIAHIAIWKLGAISVPISVLYGPEGIETRLDDASIRLGIVDDQSIDAFRAAAGRTACESVITVGVDDGDRKPSEIAFRDVINTGPGIDEIHPTAADTLAMILYTSGTTGTPKGVMLPHRILLGFLPTILTTVANMDMRENEVFWSPSEWAWAGTLFTSVLPALFYGRSTVAYTARQFDPVEAFETIDDCGVSLLYATPTVLRMMHDITAEFDVSSVRCITLGSESVDQAIKRWAFERFSGVAVNEWYGQTEAGAIAMESAALFDSREGTVGKAAIGTDFEIANRETGDRLDASGELGEIIVDYTTSRPCCFSGYWNKPDLTAAKLGDGWLRSEDLGVVDDDGYLTFYARKDDVIICSGYRISPLEVEASIVEHPAVAEAAVIGVDNELRGEIPKALIELKQGYKPSEVLKTEIQTHVKDTLAKYQYPRAIEFIDRIPTTVTGKKQRNKLQDL
jgi:acetyl-CoA synthetase